MIITLAELALDRRIAHGFFTRRGGVSKGDFSSLNCGFGSGDERAAVAENRGRAMALLATRPTALVTCYQIHSPSVVMVERPWPANAAPRADAMVTHRPGIALGVLSADCAPVLFADATAGIIAAAHAGWRGALGGVLEATVAAMASAGARRQSIRAGIGPCIAQRSYEVGPEFLEPFIAQDAENRRFFTPAARAGHCLFDLAGYIADRLGRLNLGLVMSSGHDTYAETDSFFSYRRTVHQGGQDYGRGLSAIALAD